MGGGFRAVLAATMLLLAPATALADGEINRLITPNDQARLDAHDATLAAALAEARVGASPDEIAFVESLTGERNLSWGGIDLAGRWKCRTTKVGGVLPMVTYSWFDCTITDDGAGWTLTKTSGSQRTTGRFFTISDTRMVYLGSGSVRGEEPRPHGAGEASDQVGLVFRSGDATWRIEFPAPYYESKLDILEFARP